MSDKLKAFLDKKEEILSRIVEICKGQAAMIHDRNINDLVLLDESKKPLLEELSKIEAEFEAASASKNSREKDIGEKARKINELLASLITLEKENESALSDFLNNYTGKYIDAYKKMKV
jgi:flagellar biosynthesis/type III secretory pathway chaperone